MTQTKSPIKMLPDKVVLNITVEQMLEKADFERVAQISMGQVVSMGRPVSSNDWRYYSRQYSLAF